MGPGALEAVLACVYMSDTRVAKYEGVNIQGAETHVGGVRGAGVGRGS